MRTIVYSIADRPDVEVRVTGTWRYGQLRMWTRRPDGSWWAQVTWSRAPGENMIETFAAAEVRPGTARV